MDTRRQFQDAMLEEIALWPGVEIVFGHASKHLSAVVTFRGQSRKNFYPVTSGDRRAVLNNITQLRQKLRDIGAARLEKPKHEPDERQDRPRRQMERAPARPGDKATRPDTWLGPLAALRQAMAV